MQHVLFPAAPFLMKGWSGQVYTHTPPQVCQVLGGCVSAHTEGASRIFHFPGVGTVTQPRNRKGNRDKKQTAAPLFEVFV